MMLNMDMPAAAVPTVFAFASWDGSGHRRACPLATFGCPRGSPLSLTARLVCVDPPRADSAEVVNVRELAGSIALVVRGGCSFADKARRVQAAGAIAMVLANNTREEPDAAFTMAEDEVSPGSALPSPPLSAITIPCVMMCLLDVRELFQKFPPTAPQSGVLTLEVLGHDEAEEAAAESLRLRQEMKIKYEEHQRRGGGSGGGWGVGSALKRKTTALIKLLEPQTVDQHQTSNRLPMPGDNVESTTESTTAATMDTLHPAVTIRTSIPANEEASDTRTSLQPGAKPMPLVAFVQWATSADAYHFEFAPLADFCRVSDGSVFDGPLVVCDPVLADTNRIANADELKGSIALVKRGACTFPAKFERVQRCGAVAAIVGNDDEKDPNVAFVMSVDSIKTDHITIASVMVSYSTFERLVADKAARIRILCVAPGPAAADLLARSGTRSLIMEADHDSATCEDFHDDDNAHVPRKAEYGGTQELGGEADLTVRELHATCRARNYDAFLHIISNACEDNKDQVRKLTSKRDSNWRSTLHHACAGGDERIVQLLLEHGASPFDIDVAARTALHVASAYGHSKCVELLLQAASSLIQASTGEDEDGRLVLLNPDIGGSTPIHLATAAGSTDTLELLLTATAQVTEDGTYKFDGVNERNADGATPLHLACRHEHAHCAVYLLAANADVNAVDSSGYTALAIACEMVNDCADGGASAMVFIIEKLIAAGAIMENSPMLGTTMAKLSDESSSFEAADNRSSYGRLLLDRIDSPTAKREVEILYLRHEVRTLRSSLMIAQREESRLISRVDALDRSVVELQHHNSTMLTAAKNQNATFKSQIDQLQCQMGSLLQLLRVNSDASRLIGGNCSDLSLVAAVSDSLFASSPGRLFTDSGRDISRAEKRTVTEGVHCSEHVNEKVLAYRRDEDSPSQDSASQQELALDAGLARDLGKKLLRRRQFDLAEAYFVRSLEILPLPGVSQLRDKAQAAQQGRQHGEQPSTGEGKQAIVSQTSEENAPEQQHTSQQVLSPETKEVTIKRLITAVVNSGASEHVRTSLEREVNKLKALSCSSNEFELACKWLQWLTTLPWGDPTTGLGSAASGWESWTCTSGSLDTFIELERLERDCERESEDLAARKIQRVVREWQQDHTPVNTREVVAAIKIQQRFRRWRVKRIVRAKSQIPGGSEESERADESVAFMHNKQTSLQPGRAVECDDDAVNYSLEVDKAVLRKISKTRSVSLVTGIRLCGTGGPGSHQRVRILQLLSAQKRVPRHQGRFAPSKVPGYPPAEDSTQFFVWTRWRRDQSDTHSQRALSGPYEDQEAARCRYERILASESTDLQSQAITSVPDYVKPIGHSTRTLSTASVQAHPGEQVSATSA